MALLCTTELEAVNTILRSIGEQPVNTIPTSGVSEATIAQTVLHEVSREVQGMGLNCNTEYEYPLALDVDGECSVPADALNVDPSYPTDDYVVRGRRLYDKEEHTYVFTDSPIYVDIIFFLEFEDLPEHCRRYITLRASRKFQRDLVGSSDLDTLTMYDEQMINMEFKRKELNNQDLNFGNSPLVRDVVYSR